MSFPDQPAINGVNRINSILDITTIKLGKLSNTLSKSDLDGQSLKKLESSKLSIRFNQKRE